MQIVYVGINKLYIMSTKSHEGRSAAGQTKLHKARLQELKATISPD